MLFGLGLWNLNLRPVDSNLPRQWWAKCHWSWTAVPPLGRQHSEAHSYWFSSSCWDETLLIQRLPYQFPWETSKRIQLQLSWVIETSKERKGVWRRQFDSCLCLVVLRQRFSSVQLCTFSRAQKQQHLLDWHWDRIQGVAKRYLLQSEQLLGKSLVQVSVDFHDQSSWTSLSSWSIHRRMVKIHEIFQLLSQWLQVQHAPNGLVHS